MNLTLITHEQGYNHPWRSYHRNLNVLDDVYGRDWAGIRAKVHQNSRCGILKMVLAFIIAD